MAGRQRKRDRGLIATAIVGVLLAAVAIWAWIEVVEDDELPTRGPSMRPTLTGPASVDIDTDAYDSATPEVGDVVVLQAPVGVRTESCGAPRRFDSPCAEPKLPYSNLRLLKRIVAGPGDSIAFAPDGTAIRNGERAEEPYIRPCPRGTCGLSRPIDVPDGYYFVAGDNRPDSSDSRYWGPVPEEAIDGRVLLPEGQASGSSG